MLIYAGTIHFMTQAVAQREKLSFREREIVVDKDTVAEYNKSSGVIEETFVYNGIKIMIADSLNIVTLFMSYKNNKANGVFMDFYTDTNMPRQRAVFKDNPKTGVWYYWSRKGVLIKIEVYKDDKLISKKIMAKAK